MGLKSVALLAVALIPFISPGSVHAAPKLRLANTVIGPVWVAPGASGGSQTAEAYNAGDGSLALTFSSTASWAAPSLGSPRTCSSLSGFTGSCIPIPIALNTSGLAAGTYTAIVTVSDPNAVDAPQTITVTVRVGASVDMYVAPGTARDLTFATRTTVSPSATTKDGGRWLSLTLVGIGSFRFSYPYRIRMQPPAGMGEGNYTGAVITAGAQSADDNKNIPVTMRVTSQPIAEPSSDRVRVRLAQGAASTYWDVYLNNVGQGTLTQQGATVHGDKWLAAAQYPPNLTRITLDPGSFAPGVYTGSVDIASNGVNGAVTVPVEFEIVAKGAPLAYYQGVVDNAIFGSGDAVSRGDIVDVFGEQFSFAALTGNSGTPLPTALGGASVLFNGKPAPLYFSSYGQIAFQVPVDAPLGTNLVQVQRDGVTGNTISVQVVDRAPRLLLIGNYAAATNQDYSLPMPAGYVPGWKYGTRPAQAGDWLTIYAIGLGPIQGAQVPSGAAAPSDPLPWLAEVPVVNFGVGIAAIPVVPLYAGLSPGSAGLYQVNVQVPPNTAKGDVEINLLFKGVVSNSVKIAVQ